MAVFGYDVFRMTFRRNWGRFIKCTRLFEWTVNTGCTYRHRKKLCLRLATHRMSLAGHASFHNSCIGIFLFRHLGIDRGVIVILYERNPRFWRRLLLNVFA
jgi:hypothetical protein